MMGLNIMVLLTLISSVLNIKGQNVVDKIESIEGKTDFNPNVIQARMYDYLTSTIAYKDKSTKKCYIARMQKHIPAPLYISNSKSDPKEVEILAGRGIAKFCTGMDVYKLLVQIK